jgi:hypothetical protein
MVDANTYGSADFIAMKPVRAHLICDDLPLPDNTQQLPRSMEVFLNPTVLNNFNTEAVWANIDVPGLSHQVHQYSHSKSDTFTFILYWDRILASQRAAQRANRSVLGSDAVASNPYIQSAKASSLYDPFQYKDFLRGLTVPQEPGYSPSRVTLVWPRFLHVTGIVKKVMFGFTRFSTSGQVMAFQAQVSMTEFRTVFRKRIGANSFFWDSLSNTPEIGGDSSNAEQSKDYEFSLAESEGVDYSFTYDEVYGSD